MLQHSIFHEVQFILDMSMSEAGGVEMMYPIDTVHEVTNKSRVKQTPAQLLH